MCAGLKLLDDGNQISFIFRSHVQLLTEKPEFKNGSLLQSPHFTDGKTETQERLGELPKVTLKIRNAGSNSSTQTFGILELAGFPVAAW